MARKMKTINFRVTFDSQTHLFICEQHKAAEEIASHFGINIREVIMYKVVKDKKSRISPDSISDFNQIEIVSNGNTQRDIQASLENGASKKIVDDIVQRLRDNRLLLPNERKLLITALETHSTAIFKRKFNQIEGNIPTEIQKPVVHNKKLQAVIPGKESFTQTDPVNTPLNTIDNPVNNEENARCKLKRLWNLNHKPDERIDLLMKETFDERRSLITVHGSPVKLIKEQFPYLFCFEQVKNELERIFYPGKCLEFLNNMNKYTQHILYYKEDGDKVKEVFDIIAKARDRAKTQVKKTYVEVVGSIFLLAKLLDEDFGFIHLHDYAHSSKDLFPFIDASLYTLNEIFLGDIHFHIKVEGEELCETSNFPEAILCLLATFFIFNISYPDRCNCTLTVMEKVFLEANDTEEMDDKTQQWIKLLTMREMKSKTRPSKSNIEGKSKSKKSFLKR